MKCRKCGASLRDIDSICLNCGTLVGNNNDNDLYDDINTDEDDFSDSDSDNDSSYNKELDDLLNSYNMEDKNKDNEIPDYSSFNSFGDEDTTIKEDKVDEPIVLDQNSFFNGVEDENISTGGDGLDDYTIDNLIDFRDTGSSYAYDNKKQKKEKKKFEFNISIIPFKVIFIIAAVVLVILLCVLGYKFLSGFKSEKVDYEIDKDREKVTSKLSLKSNPNYIDNRTWVCGTMVNGELTTDRSTYFQYDFNKNNRYARQFLDRPDTYENGTYGVSLEDNSNDRYLYKLYIIANLDGGYKTKYTFTLNVNKDGTKAIYKYNSAEFACEEMNYYNSKIG